MAGTRVGKSKQQKFKIEVDERTAMMPAEALECRSVNHPWSRVPPGAERRAMLLAKGQSETVRVCTRCGSKRIELVWLPSYEEASPTRYEWSDNYLISKEFAGTGRLPKAEAKKAQFARENPDLVQ